MRQIDIIIVLTQLLYSANVLYALPIYYLRNCLNRAIIFSFPWGNKTLSLYSATVIFLAAAAFCTVFINFSSGLLSRIPYRFTNLSTSISTAINPQRNGAGEKSENNFKIHLRSVENYGSILRTIEKGGQ